MKFNKYIKIIILYIINKLYVKKNEAIENDHIKNQNNYLLKFNINTNDYIFFNIISIDDFISIKYKIIKRKLKLLILDKNKNFISPSDLSLYKNINIICFIQIINKNIIINSYPNIYKNKFYECIEFIKINEKIKLGIKIYKSELTKGKPKVFTYYFTYYKIINYKNINSENNILFDPLLVNKDYIRLSKSIYKLKINETLRLKKLYIQFPIYNLKREITIYENRWYFRNINNNYFCLCRGSFCKQDKNYKKCKYLIYLNIIDKARNLYKKNEYFLLDFVFHEFSSDDVYPIFKEMFNQHKPVHYMTENMEIYNEYCFNKNKCLDIIYVNKNNYTINGDFLENYLDLILKLKQVISAGGINIFYYENLFYNIEYITYICVGHGISFFKYFLYNSYNWYGHKVFDKILIPPSKILISVLRKSGWKDENIIKINLPRRDKFNINNFNKYVDTINNNSIFIMFTWRKIKKNKKISIDYFKNIKNLINKKSCICI